MAQNPTAMQPDRRPYTIKRVSVKRLFRQGAVQAAKKEHHKILYKKEVITVKTKRRILSAILGLSIAASMFPLGASAASGSLKSDTTAPFSVGVGKNYTFKITANGTSQKPVVTVANGKALKVLFKGQQGNNYFYMVTAIGQEGSTSGVYMALPGQSPIRCCIVTVGMQSSQQTPTTINLSDLNYVTEQRTDDYKQFPFQYYNITEQESSSFLISNDSSVYKNGLLVEAGNLSGSGVDLDETVYRDYLLNGNYSKFSTVFALSQYSRDLGACEWTLTIYGDGKQLYTSDTLTAGVLPQNINVDVTNVKSLRLETHFIADTWEPSYQTGCVGLYNAQLCK